MRVKRYIRALQHLPTEWQVQKAKRACVKRDGACVICGATHKLFGWLLLNAHHRVPVHVNPGLAAVLYNLVCLCRVCHLQWGHPGGWKKWCSNLEHVIGRIKAARAESVVEE